MGALRSLKLTVVDPPIIPTLPAETFMTAARFFAATVLCFVAIAMAAKATEGEERLIVHPASPTMQGPSARQQLLVTKESGDQQMDATDQAKYSSSDAKVARVTPEGVVRSVADGTADILVKVDGVQAKVRVTISGTGDSAPLHFRNDIVSLLSKAGCNAGSCHGKQGGQNGFGLSVFGFDPAADYDALVREGRGRRLFPAAPARSLLLTKATNQTPHGGGLRLDPESEEYERLHRWIATGMPWGADDAPHVVSIEVYPPQRRMLEQSTQRLQVTATFSDGEQRDVTHEALYSSNDETLAQVDKDGRVSTTMLAGEAAIVARYHHAVASCRVTIPIHSSSVAQAELAQWDRRHFVDRLVAEKWEQLYLAPSDLADDATFLRRLHLDLLGKAPSPEEAAAFIADADPNKRSKKADALLERPEYADYWSLKWADLLRINQQDLGSKAASQYHEWVRNSLLNNQPYDAFVRDLITAKGSSERNGAVHFYKAFAKPDDLSIAVSQVFLGVRLGCAKCHHHPYENWSQEDFYGLAAFFPRLQKKKGRGTELIYYIGSKGQVKHPRTSAIVAPCVLLGEPTTTEEGTVAAGDPRVELADWMASPDNPFLARTLVNRLWAHFLGRGLVEPVDDMRDTNPATNEALLAALTEEFIKHKYDVRHLIRVIVTSNVYGLSSQPNAVNLRDTQNYSRAYRRRLEAEVLLDAICDAAGETETFAGMPPGTRAVQLWDHRLPSRFLDTFGRPPRKTVCECERVEESTLSQILHLMNSPVVSDKITSPTGRAAKLAASDVRPEEIVSQIYLAAYGRYPRSAEQQAALAAFTAPGATRRTAAEDILWALLNSAEFVLNH